MALLLPLSSSYHYNFTKFILIDLQCLIALPVQLQLQLYSYRVQVIPRYGRFVAPFSFDTVLITKSFPQLNKLYESVAPADVPSIQFMVDANYTVSGGSVMVRQHLSCLGSSTYCMLFMLYPVISILAQLRQGARTHTHTHTHLSLGSTGHTQHYII